MLPTLARILQFLKEQAEYGGDSGFRVGWSALATGRWRALSLGTYVGNLEIALAESGTQ